MGKIIKFLITLIFVVCSITLADHSAWCEDKSIPAADKKEQSSGYRTPGAGIFSANCSRCHPNGGNVIIPDLPLRGSAKLSDFGTFLAFIRNPKMPDGSEGIMPSFSNRQLSDRQARRLYQYITSAESSGEIGNGYGMRRGMMGRGMMGGYGMEPGMMGRGMMGGYGMGPGMMGGYSQSEECQKFLDDTAGLRRELYDKRFEYSEAYRNPKTSAETLVKLEREILEIQKKIYVKAPLGCRW